MLRDENSLFAQLFNNTQSLVALFRPADNHFVQINTFGLDMFGMTHPAEFIESVESGTIWYNKPVDAATYFSHIKTIVKQAGKLEKETLYQTAAGKPFWGLLRIDTLNIETEEYLLIKITNIDRYKKAELAAVRSSEQFEALFKNSAIGIVVVNSEARIINLNQFAEEQFNYRKEEIIGQPVEILLPNKFRKSHHTFRTNFINAPTNRVMGAGRELYALRKNGSEFPVEISLSHYTIENQNYVIAFVVDISLRKRNESVVLRQKEELEKISNEMKTLNSGLEKTVDDRTKMLKETLAELEISKEELRIALEKERELGELKSRFVTMASHEFRTPLSAILSSSYIVQQYERTEEQEKRKKHLARINNAVQNLTFILEDFLSLEKLEEGLVHIKIQHINEGDLHDEIEAILEGLGQILKIGQQFRYIHSKDAFVNTDKKLLRNILINLISNAAKYSPENSLVTITTVHEAQKLKIAVTDCGVGIPEAEKKHLFERFFRASNVLNIQGTGLGLHIVSRYLTLIDGTIEFVSEVDKGTTVTVILAA